MYGILSSGSNLDHCQLRQPSNLADQPIRAKMGYQNGLEQRTPTPVFKPRIVPEHRGLLIPRSQVRSLPGPSRKSVQVREKGHEFNLSFRHDVTSRSDAT